MNDTNTESVGILLDNIQRQYFERIQRQAEARIQQIDNSDSQQAQRTAMSSSNTISFNNIDETNSFATTSSVLTNEITLDSARTISYSKYHDSLDSVQLHRLAKLRCPYSMESDQARIWIDAFEEAANYFTNREHVYETFDKPDGGLYTQEDSSRSSDANSIQSVENDDDEESGFDIEEIEETDETHNENNNGQ